MDIPQLIDRYGFPGGLLLVAVVAIYRIAAWIRPKADSIFDAHIAMVNSVSKAAESNAINNETQTKTTEAILGQVSEQTTELRKQTGILMDPLKQCMAMEAAKLVVAEAVLQRKIVIDAAEEAKTNLAATATETRINLENIVRGQKQVIMDEIERAKAAILKIKNGVKE